MKRNKKGFTLIELLAVIVILGILVLVAIPAVSSYITNSRKSAYVSTAKAIMKGTMNLANDGTLDLSNENLTYYIPASCVEVDNTTSSPYGKFVKAYTAVALHGDGYVYYWASVDETGMGVTIPVELDKLSTDDIVSNIDPAEFQTNRGIGNTTGIMIFNDDCTSMRDATIKASVTFNAGEGFFPDGSKTNILNLTNIVSAEPITVTKYSHTENVTDDGNKTRDYDNNWGNINITGTDKAYSNDAHVVTIPGASNLHVRITYGGESGWDWVCMWEGSHPDKTAAGSNCDSSKTGKLSGGSHTASSNTVEYDVEGDSVTFAFKSDSSNCGDGYGYYAVVTGEVDNDSSTGYIIPTAEYATFTHWVNDADGTTCNNINCAMANDGDSFTAVYDYLNTLAFVKNSGSIYVDGSYSYTNSISRTSGTTVRLSGSTKGQTITAYPSNGYYTITYDSDGGSSVSSQTLNKRKRLSYTFNRYEFSGDCGTVAQVSNGTTYTFPSTKGTTCTVTTIFDETVEDLPDTYTYSLRAAPTKAGYTFTGWKSSVNNQIYSPGESYAATSDVTMTAQWEAN